MPALLSTDVARLGWARVKVPHLEMAAAEVTVPLVTGGPAEFDPLLPLFAQASGVRSASQCVTTNCDASVNAQLLPKAQLKVTNTFEVPEDLLMCQNSQVLTLY